ncbi:MAG TPA: cation transporter [bacterium]|nr:cation transporter [bacterium]
MADVILSVPDMSCEHCERTVRGALGPLEGVRSVTVDLRAKQVRVAYDERLVSVDRMKDALRQEEYPVASSTQA